MVRTADKPGAQTDAHRFFLSLAALFDEDFSIYWVQELAETDVSAILVAMEDEAHQGLLARKTAGIYSFIDSRQK
ncbi:hypothetical protein DRH13_05635, partial [Candidatus Woesebacteria bacterium]